MAGSTPRTSASVTCAGSSTQAECGRQHLGRGHHAGRAARQRAARTARRRCSAGPAAQPARQKTSAYWPISALPGGAISRHSPAAKPVTMPGQRACRHRQRAHEHQDQVGYAAAGQAQPVQDGELQHDPSASTTGASQALRTSAARRGRRRRARPVGSRRAVTVTVTVGPGMRQRRQRREPRVVAGRHDDDADDAERGEVDERPDQRRPRSASRRADQLGDRPRPARPARTACPSTDADVTSWSPGLSAGRGAAASAGASARCRWRSRPGR